MKLLKSKFFIISVAVVLSLALITGVLAMLGFTGPVKTVLGTVATPFRLFGTWASDAVNGFVEVFADYDDLKAENEALKNELQSLKDEKYNNEVLKEENEWLKEYIDVATEHPDFKLSDASVIARQSNNYSTVLTLNRGTAHGIKTKMPVITEEGLFGQVTEVGLDWCKVESIIETEVSVGVYSQRSGAGGVAKGEGGILGDGICRMTCFDSDADILIGDRIYTSGGDGSSYPSGLYVGEISGIDADEATRTLTARITPAAAHGETDGISRMMIVLGYDGGK